VVAPASRVERLASSAKEWRDSLLFIGLLLAYPTALSGVFALTDVQKHAPVWVVLVLVFGGWLVAYHLAVQTVAWWRRRQARQG